VRTLPHDLDFDRAFEYAREHIGITQQPEEIGRLWELVRSLRPKRVLEIGLDEGGTLFLWTRAASPDARLIAVDTRPPGKLGPISPYQLVRRSFATEDQRVSLLLGRDSHVLETFDDVRDLLAGEPLDFLFIDGDHSYDGVKRDFELYSTLVRPGGIIGLHDVWPAQRQNGQDAPNDGSVRFWRELEDGRDTEVASVHAPDG
jgi:predicted O-methyltransferase YrrM